MKLRNLMVGAALSVAVLGAGASAASSLSSQGPEPEVNATPEARQMFEQAHAEGLESTRADAPRPYVADEVQREAWIASWNRYRACLIEHGYAGAPAVASTFGDGQTPWPVVDTQAGNYSMAQENCQMDPTGIDREMWAAALREATERTTEAGG